MEEDPIRNQDGNLLCPRCKIELTRGITSFSFKDEYLGKFEAVVCDICNYSLLTAQGYDQAMEVARSFGLIGSPEILSKVIEEMQERVVEQMSVPSNLTFSWKVKLKDSSNESLPTTDQSKSYIYTTKKLLLFATS